MELNESILAVFKAQPRRLLRLADVMKAVRVPAEERRTVQRALNELRQEGRIVVARAGRYTLAPTQPDLDIGRLSVNPRGFGFVRRGDASGAPRGKSKDTPDVYINARHMADAIHGDLVLFQITGALEPGKPEGRVVNVLERGTKTLVGRYHRRGSSRRTRAGGIVVPRDRRLGRNVQVVAAPPPDELPDDAWVLVKLRDYPPPPDDLVGEIAEILGDDDTPGIDVLLVLRDYGVTAEFSKEALAEADRLPGAISERELEGRADFRALTTVTIDGWDAKDFDDALSIERRADGGFRLYVHIADVAHYVAEGSAIDAEAVARATSIYPVDRVVPMLPERLSNDLCSLRPDVDRLTMSAVIDLSRTGEIEDHSLHSSVIRSRLRLTYRDTQAFYDGIDSAATRRLRPVGEELQALLELMEILRAKRLERGALDLDLPEVEIEFDDDGTIENVFHAPRWKSHQVIEECMILANEVVARALTKAGAPILYRVHEPPTRDSLLRLAPILEPFGVKIALRSRQPLGEQLQRALAAVSRLEAAHILNRVVLRSLTEARYQPANVGHFGLASECYTHFTSPIRRYPDLLVHRALKRLLAAGDGGGQLDKQWMDAQTADLPGMGAHVSDLERRASAIEDEATRICALEFMRRHLGETFDGYVAGVMSFGLFVQLRRYPIEGLLHVRDLHDDRYEYDEATLILSGRRSGRRFRIGQPVEVVIHRVDVLNQEMDLRLALLEENRPRRGAHLYQSRRRPRGW